MLELVIRGFKVHLDSLFIYTDASSMTSYMTELCADGLTIMMRHFALTEETTKPHLD